MIMKPDEKVISLFCILLLSFALCYGCSSRRSSITTTRTQQTDSLRIYIKADTTSSVNDAHQVHQSENVTNVQTRVIVTIERDSMGLPVKYTYSGNYRSHSSASDSIGSTDSSFNTNKSTHGDFKQATKASVKDEVKKDTTTGMPLEKLVGIPILIFVIVCVIYTLISNGIKKNRYL